MAVSSEAQGPLPSLLVIGRIQFPVVVGLTEFLGSQRLFAFPACPAHHNMAV